MSEISKTVGQLIINNVGVAVVILLFILSGLFKITKVELNPIKTFVNWVGKIFTQDVKKDIANLKVNTNSKIDELKTNTTTQIESVKIETNTKISELRNDLDAFETKTNKSIEEMKMGTSANCELLKIRLDLMEKSNDMQSVRQIKGHILDFANSCRNGRKHTMEDFKNILAENSEYEALVKKYNLVNDVYSEDLKFIKNVYQHCLETNSFLA